MLTFTQILRNRKLYEEAVLRQQHMLPARGHVQARPTLDAADDDYEFVNASLQRWADRKYR